MSDTTDDLFTPAAPDAEPDEMVMPEDLRRVICYYANEAHDAVQEALGPLGRGGGVYQRSNRLVQILGAADALSDGVSRDENAPVINPMSRGRLWEHLSEAICWMKLDARAKKEVGCAPPGDVVKDDLMIDRPPKSRQGLRRRPGQDP